jgi:HD superfamily phosphohydrolase
VEKTLRDSVHGNIRLSEAELEVLDTPQMQRLRGVKQLGFSYLVYPGANHTRFEHSLGTMHICGMFAEHFGYDEVIRMAGLLHDVGHMPFSHLLEDLMGRTHEERTVEIVKNDLSGVLEKHGFGIKEVIEKIKDPALCGPLGSDRLDYLMRDAHYCGVAYGIIDLERVLDILEKKGKDLVIKEKGIETAESVLLARYLMFPTVYSHHVARIAGNMLKRAVKFAVDRGELNSGHIQDMKDEELLMRLKDTGSGHIVKRISERRLLKRLFVSKKEPKAKNLFALERSIEKRLGLNPGEIIIDAPPRVYRKEELRTEKGILRTPIIDSLERAYQEHELTSIYAPQGTSVEKILSNLF